MNIYLDNNATTQLEPDVVERIVFAAQNAWGNPSSCYEQGRLAKELIEDARLHIVEMIGGKENEKNDIIFTSGGTESNHLAIRSAIKSWKCHHKYNKDVSNQTHTGNCNIPHVVTSNIEHDSVQLLLRQWEKLGRIELTEVPANQKSARVEVDDVIAALRHNTCLVTIMLANNETGVIQPVKELFERISSLPRQQNVRERILLHTDAAQAVGKINIDVNDLKTDYLTIVGHKFYGPRIGALYVRNINTEKTLFPLFYGGGQERGFRPGTENTPMIVGLGQAAKIVKCRLHDDEKQMRALRDYLEIELTKTFKEVHFNGRFRVSERLPNTCNVSIIDGNLKGNVILKNCERLQASVGAACHDQNKPSHILKCVGVDDVVANSALRLSVGRYTTREDIDAVVLDLKQSIAGIQNDGRI